MSYEQNGAGLPFEGLHTPVQLAHIKQSLDAYGILIGCFRPEGQTIYSPDVKEIDLLCTRIPTESISTREQRGIMTTTLVPDTTATVTLEDVHNNLSLGRERGFTAARMCRLLAEHLIPGAELPQVGDFVHQTRSSLNILDRAYTAKGIRMPRHLSGVCTKAVETVTSVGGDPAYFGKGKPWSRYVDYRWVVTNTDNGVLVVGDIRPTWHSDCFDAVRKKSKELKEAIRSGDVARGVIYSR